MIIEKWEGICGYKEPTEQQGWQGMQKALLSQACSKLYVKISACPGLRETSQQPRQTTFRRSQPCSLVFVANSSFLCEEQTSKSVHPRYFPPGLSCWHLICFFFAFFFFWWSLLEIKFQPSASPRWRQAHCTLTLEFKSIKSLLALSPCLVLLVSALKWLSFKLRLLWGNWKRCVFHSLCLRQEFLLHHLQLLSKATSGGCAAARSGVCASAVSLTHFARSMCEKSGSDSKSSCSCATHSFRETRERRC